jgi:hypothetical protein
MVLGNADYYAQSQIVRNPAIADELLIAASWYLSGKDVQNAYTTISYAPFRDRFCRVFNGGTCANALRAVLATEPTTGKPWVDLLSVSTLVIYRPFFPHTDLSRPPRGWTVSEATTYTVVWKRNTRLPSAGGVVATSEGLTVTEDRAGDRELRLRVDRVGKGGGTVTLSRLDWPGYSVRGARLVDPLDDILVRVAVPAGSEGSTVVVRWAPPGWGVEVTALGTAVLGGGLWAVLMWVVERRRRAATHGAAAPPPVPGAAPAAP